MCLLVVLYSGNGSLVLVLAPWGDFISGLVPSLKTEDSFRKMPFFLVTVRITLRKTHEPGRTVGNVDKVLIEWACRRQ